MAEYECLSDFVPDIRMEITDIDDRTIKMVLGQAQAKFCRDTRVLQQTISTTIDSTKSVYHCIPQWSGFNQTIDRVLVGSSEDSLSDLQFNSQFTISPDRTYITLDDGYLSDRIEGYVIDIISTIIPYKNTEEIDTDVYELYGFIIIVLAKHLIYNMKKKAWSDQESAAQLLFEYNEMLNTVQFDNAAGGNTSGDQSMNLDIF